MLILGDFDFRGLAHTILNLFTFFTGGSENLALTERLRHLLIIEHKQRPLRHSWPTYLTYLPDLPTWPAYWTYLLDLTTWPTYLTYLPDLPTWSTYMTNLPDLPTRPTYLTCLPDLPTWPNYLNFLPDLPTYLTYLPCEIWDTDYNSDNWELEFMTIFVTQQLRMTVDSIRNSCDV